MYFKELNHFLFQKLYKRFRLIKHVLHLNFLQTILAPQLQKANCVEPKNSTYSQTYSYTPHKSHCNHMTITWNKYGNVNLKHNSRSVI